MMKQTENPVRVRLAPSPTGPLHIGTVRTALFNWLFTRQNGGAFILRVEDTDKERSEKKYEDDIIRGLRWLGLDWDEGPASPEAKQFPISPPALLRNAKRAGNFQFPKNSGRKLEVVSHKSDFGPYRQSERSEIYKKYLKKLLDGGQAYYCYCSKEDLEAERQAMLAQGLPPKYSGHCRQYADGRRQQAELRGKKPQVIRFKTPEGKVEFKDIVRGNVVFDASLFGDIVIAKDLKTPLYNFAATVDDEEMKISHVIRGEDHLSNTPKQILLQRALGFREPQYGHLPLILNPDKSKMSKRFADTALSEYISRGYLPEALVNFLALLGWHPRDERELFSLAELTEKFDLKRVQKAGAVFGQDKLAWLQREHMKSASAGRIADLLKPFLARENVKYDKKFLEKIIEMERPRLTTLSGFYGLTSFFFELPDYDARLLSWKSAEAANKIKTILRAELDLTESLQTINTAALQAALAPLIAKEGRGAALWPLRVALSGLAASPDPFEIAEVLGKDETIRRIKIAESKLAEIQ